MHPTSMETARAGAPSAAAARQSGEGESGGRRRPGSQSLLRAAARAGAVVPRDATTKPAPRTAELVESLDDGRYFLRAHHQGRYWWQPVPSPTQSIPNDAQAWQADDGGLSRQYWLNHGEFRLRQGAYHRMAGSRDGTR